MDYRSNSSTSPPPPGTFPTGSSSRESIPHYSEEPLKNAEPFVTTIQTFEKPMSQEITRPLPAFKLDFVFERVSPSFEAGLPKYAVSCYHSSHPDGRRVRWFLGETPTLFHATQPPTQPSAIVGRRRGGREGGSLERSENGFAATAFSGARPTDQSRPLWRFNNILACTKWVAAACWLLLAALSPSFSLNGMVCNAGDDSGDPVQV